MLSGSAARTLSALDNHVVFACSTGLALVPFGMQSPTRAYACCRAGIDIGILGRGMMCGCHLAIAHVRTQPTMGVADFSMVMTAVPDRSSGCHQHRSRAAYWTSTVLPAKRTSAPSLPVRTKPHVRGQIGGGRRSAVACTGRILDIFEGTQQIQQLIVARRLLGKTSAELK
jgi:hypothetical protein